MKKLSQEGFERARDYIFSNGRPLDQALFNYHFNAGPAEAVLTALASFQNDDGGFGHALEPDLRTPASSAIATSHGFDLLRQLNTPVDHPLVGKAIVYLLNTFDEKRLVWPIVPPAVDNAPRAFWWAYEDTEENFGRFLVNPRAVLLAHLWHYHQRVPQQFLVELTTAVLAHMDALPDEMGMHDLACFLILAQSSNLPATETARIVAKLRRIIPNSVELDQGKWDTYCLKPLDVAPSPEGWPAETVPAEAVAAQLDMEIEAQLPDGSWPLGWSWAALDADAWAQAERDWKGHLAVGQLKRFRDYGRLANG